jgi:hypothetical protein
LSPREGIATSNVEPKCELSSLTKCRRVREVYSQVSSHEDDMATVLTANQSAHRSSPSPSSALPPLHSLDTSPACHAPDRGLTRRIQDKRKSLEHGTHLGWVPSREFAASWRTYHPPCRLLALKDRCAVGTSCGLTMIDRPRVVDLKDAGTALRHRSNHTRRVLV